MNQDTEACLEVAFSINLKIYRALNDELFGFGQNKDGAGEQAANITVLKNWREESLDSFHFIIFLI